MRIPISWLREFVDVPLDATPDDVHTALVKVGLEEEDLHTFELDGPIVVGEVLEFIDEPQSNGKTIRWCQVRVASSDSADAVRGIVCGAHNFVVGDKVVVSLPGAVLPGPTVAEPFVISARKTYGHLSDGMIASARELGLGDEHDGILRLAELDLDAEVGANAVALLGLDDWAVEVNVTPDRGYALSIRGIAREYSHATGAAFRDPARLPLPEGSRSDRLDGGTENPVPVVIADTAPIRNNPGTSIFVTRIVRGVDPARHTPARMIARLKLAGIRSISLIVDITNYVMLELGQPIHGYDLDKLTGAITVRRAKPGERLTTLDDQTRVLDPEDLLIADETGPIGLAGVMGGAATEIGTGTVNVLIEAANFDPISIARTARRHKLPSEASKRFERGVDPAVATPAASRVAQLLVELAGGTADPAIWQVGDVPAIETILLPEGYVNSLVGADYTDAETTGTLSDIGATVEITDGGLLVTPPSWRPDLRDKADLAEEVARVVGYDRIPAVLPTAPPGRGLTRAQRLRRAAAQMLAGNGLTEVMAYPFVSAISNDMFGSRVAGTVPAFAVANPLDGAVPYLRTSLLPGLIETAQRNLSRGLVDLALFEFGTVFLPEKGREYGFGSLPAGNERPTDAMLASLNDNIPTQPLRAAALFLGNVVEKQPGQPAIPAGLADVLTAAHQLAHSLAAELEVRPGSHQALHPGRTAELFVDGESIGIAGELLPALAAEFDLSHRVAVLELDFERLIELAPVDVTPSAIATLPAATQDVSLVVAEDVPAGDVLAAIISGTGQLLEHAQLIDDYRGPGVADGAKSLTFALRFRAADRTLTAAEATEAKMAGVASAAAKFGATLRE